MDKEGEMERERKIERESKRMRERKKYDTQRELHSQRGKDTAYLKTTMKVVWSQFSITTYYRFIIMRANYVMKHLDLIKMSVMVYFKINHIYNIRSPLSSVFL